MSDCNQRNTAGAIMNATRTSPTSNVNSIKINPICISMRLILALCNDENVIVAYLATWAHKFSDMNFISDNSGTNFHERVRFPNMEPTRFALRVGVASANLCCHAHSGRLSFLFTTARYMIRNRPWPYRAAKLLRSGAAWRAWYCLM